jgi:fucokinase
LSNNKQQTRSIISPLIEQGYRESWQRYHQALEAPPRVWPEWDWIVLTAADERQAKAFELQLDWRRKAGLLPRAMQFAVVADPKGRRVGSGGATLHALGEIGRRLAQSTRGHMDQAPAELFAHKRILLLHSGGESRRLPHCAAFGKVFARVPRELPDGRASTLFDEFLISLSGLPFRMHEGVFVASGDVLLLFDHRQLDLSRQGVVGVAARAPAETGTRHGVYVAEPALHIVRRFLHKVGLAELKSAGAADASGDVAIDTGMVWLDPPAVAALLDLFGFDEQMQFAPNGPFSEIVATGAQLNLYSDLLMPLALDTVREAYLADASDGPPAPIVQQLRPTIWERFRGIPFHVQSLAPVEFIHFGTTAEYVAVMTEGLQCRAPLGWKTPVASYCPRPPEGAQAAIVGSSLPSVAESGANRYVVEDCWLGDNVSIGDRCLMTHVWTGRAIALEPGVVLHQLPVQVGNGSLPRGFVTHLYGVKDNPKLPFEQSAATFVNRPWSEWLGDAGISPADLWPEAQGEERSLWTARLFPVAETRDESLALALWMQRPSDADEETRRRWLAARRLSLAESARQADVLQIIKDLKHLDDQVRVQRFCAAIEQERPSRAVIAELGENPSDVRRRVGMAAEQFTAVNQPILLIRGFKSLADALLGQSSNKLCLKEGRRYEDRAFGVLARAIREATPWPVEEQSAAWSRHERLRRAVVESPARVDLAGGWSDTPPFSIEYGGAVLNAAVRLRSRMPIRVECEVLERRVLVLESRDLDVSREFDQMGPIGDYADPSDPLALHKAAIVLAGLAPVKRGRPEADLARTLDRVLGGGLRVSTEVGVPHGSGLGTSSILAGAVLACLRVALGRAVEFETIFDEVLCLEQMLTTGGGWQDQVGGMVGGIKLSTTQPGLPQRPHIEPLPLRPEVVEDLRRRLVLINTGQRRLAKGILRAIMGRFMSRDPEVVQILCGIRQIAAAQRTALERGDLDEVGRLMAEHWEMNKRMDPGTSNPSIDDLFRTCAPYASGAKLAGAGGGGFVILIARDEEAPARLAQVLESAYPSSDVAPWPFEMSDQGLLVAEP